MINIMGSSIQRPVIRSTEDQDYSFSDHFSSREEQAQYKIQKMTPKMIKKAMERKKICTNSKTLGGWDLEEFTMDSIYLYSDLSDKKIYCFTKLDEALLGNTNPYTGQPFTDDVKERLYEMKFVAPLSFYSRKLCPVFRNTSDLVFVVRSERYNGYYLVDKAASYSVEKVFAGALKTPRRPGEILFSKDRFIALKLIYDGSDDQIPLEQKGRVIRKAMGSGIILLSDIPRDLDLNLLGPSDIFKELQAYMSYDSLSLSRGSVNVLKSQHIRLDIPLCLFRGLSFKTPIWMVSVGDYVTLKDRSESSSWTSNICIAEFFAGDTGYVVEYQAQPDEVVIDTRLLRKDVLDELTQANQAEVILDRRERRVKIVMILKDNTYIKTLEE